MMHSTLFFLLCLFVVDVAIAQSYLIENAKIVTGNANTSKERTHVLIEDGIIKRIAPSIPINDSVKRIDAEGMTLTYGFFNAATQIGIEEIGAIDSTSDTSTENARISASLAVLDAFNPESVLIEYNRSLGISHALVLPESEHHIIAGSAGVIRLGGDAHVRKKSAAMVVTLGAKGSALAGGSRAAALAMLREALEDARDYARNRNAFEQGRRRDYALSRHDLEALLPVIQRTVPLIVHVDRASDIEQVLSLAAAQNIKLILIGAREAWKVAEQIAKAKVPVIIDPIDNLPISYEAIHSRLDNAALLHRAGVQLLFKGMGWQGSHNAYLVRQSAGNAVANGLPHEAAIAALTLTPASVFKLARTGDVVVGNAANLVLWSGDPLEPRTAVKAVFMMGEIQPLRSRATELRDRYWQRYKDWRPH